MSTRYINKYAGSTATDKPTSRSKAAGIGFDTTTSQVNVDNAGTLVPIVDGTSVQTLTNKNFIEPLQTITGDGAVTISSGSVLLTKGSAAAITLAAPTAAQVGTAITIFAGSAFAHVLTATGLLNNGTTGGPHNTWTSAAFKGSSITLIAMTDLTWYVAGQVLGTVA